MILLAAVAKTSAEQTSRQLFALQIATAAFCVSFGGWTQYHLLFIHLGAFHLFLEKLRKKHDVPRAQSAVFEIAKRFIALSLVE
jgi:predicted Kef-type K+ transport protein